MIPHLDRFISREVSTYRLGNFEDSALASEKNGSGQDALNNLASNSLIETLNALFPNDSEEAI